MLLLLLKLLVSYTCTSLVVGKEISVRRYNASLQTQLMQCNLQDSIVNIRVLENRTAFQINEPVLQYENTDDNVIQPDLINMWRFPLSIAVNSSGLSERCQRSTQEFLIGINNHELWALKMLDATAKLPSGILSGNVNQFGDYDECLSVPQAQYCLAEIDLEPVWTQPYLSYKNLVHSHFAYRGNFDDPQHRVPDFTSIRWGICIPSECSSEDLQHSLEKNLGVFSRVRPFMCRKAEAPASSLTFGDYFARLFFVMLLLAVTTSSIAVQYKAFLTRSENTLARLLLAFSVQDNWKQLTRVVSNTSTDVNSNKRHNAEIRAVHGIRALSALALVICHKSVALMYNPYINRTAMVENLVMPWSVLGRTAIVYTDSFMLISGLLTTRSILQDMELHGSLKFKDKLINRIFRITPNILVLILFCTYILPNINSGPLWPIVVQQHADLCKQHMWRNIFYIHNYFGFENMCLTHTHQVGIDMQLYLFTPILIYTWHYSKKWGLTLAGTLAALSTFLRYYVTVSHNLSTVIYPGISIKQMFDTTNLSYILPTHRATIYITGVLLAYVLKSSNFALNKLQAGFCWIMALSCGILAVCGPFHMARIGYIYNNVGAAVYGAFSPVLWGVCIAWVIFAANRDYAGWFGDFLSWRGFQLFTKIAYAFYLVQFPVFFYYVGIQKNADEFKPTVLLEFTEIAVILLFSLVLTICVEMPFQKFKRVLFDSSNGKTSLQLQDSTKVKNMRHIKRG